MSNFKIANLNIRSLPANYTNLKNHVLGSQVQYDLICLSETWLHNAITDASISLKIYKLFRQDRILGRGGGVAIYVRDTIRAVMMTDLPLQDTEQLWLKIHVRYKSIIVGVIYNPPKYSATFLDIFEECTAAVAIKDCPIICCGDFNINVLETGCQTCSRLSDILEAFELTQNVDMPTRVTGTSAAILDLCITSSSLLVSVCRVHEDLDFTSDHYLIDLEISNVKSIVKDKYIYSRSLKNIDANNFYQDLHNLPFSDIFYINDLNLKLDTFNKLILNLFDIHAPLKRIKIVANKNKPWMTDNIRLLMKLRDKALQKFKQVKSVVS